MIKYNLFKTINFASAITAIVTILYFIFKHEKERGHLIAGKCKIVK